MRIHLGPPRESLFAVVGDESGAVRNSAGRVLSLRPKRQITHLYGISWRVRTGFVFIGYQFHKKQEGES